MSRNLVLALAFAAGAASAHGDTIEKIGKDVAIALPVAATGISAAKSDWGGVGELVIETTATVGTAYLLKKVTHEERPDHSDTESFPSDTAALAFAPAQYLWDRYGWQYGLPAYVAAGFVGYSRVEAKKHHWWDVAASAGIAFGYSEFIVTRYHKPRDLETGLYASSDGAYVALDYRF